MGNPNMRADDEMITKIPRINFLERASEKPGTFKVPDMTKIAEEMRQVERNRQRREREEEIEARRKVLAKLAALPIEERLARIEAWIYDYRPQYVPPPRFG